jgi:membrane-bound lytic murein transglycosylase D
MKESTRQNRKLGATASIAPRHLKMLGIGTLVTGMSLTAAWSLGRGSSEVEESPVEVMLEMPEAAKVEAVVWDLPVTRNESVEAWIGFLKGHNAEKTELWLERQGKYGPMIRAELRRRGMPEDLLYLALIESGFSPKAYSKAAASGLWQFIAETGRRYGLEVSPEVDERRDPIHSTTAALDYLQELYDRFGSWYLAAAAYNTGENRVDRILRERARGARGDDALFWKIAPYLPRETRDYVPLMLAAGHIAKEPEKYGFDDLEYQTPLEFETVWVPSSTELSLVAEASGVDRAAVTELNPHLTKGRTPSDRAYAVRVPTGSRVAFEEKFPALYRESRLARARERAKGAEQVAAAALVHAKHRVRSGETLGHIARRYGVSVSALRSANGNVSPRRLRAGQTLRIPGAVSAVAAKKKATKPSARATQHTVRRGENLSVIARRYGTTVPKIRLWNNLRSSRIYAGQRLRIRS